jgi:hypothetical protein
MKASSISRSSSKSHRHYYPGLRHRRRHILKISTIYPFLQTNMACKFVFCLWALEITLKFDPNKRISIKNCMQFSQGSLLSLHAK